MAVRETAGHLIEGMDGRARAFVQVQNGCDHRCTFCIIPYGRGPSRSVPMGAVVEQMQAAGRQRLSRAGADRRRHHIAMAPTCRASRASASWCRRSSGMCRTCRGCGSPRSTRSRPTRRCSRPSRDPPADAAPASQPAVGRRPDPQAHEAPAFARRHAGVRRKSPGAAAGHGVRRRPHRRLSRPRPRTMFENTLRIVEEAGLTYLHVFPFSPREGTPAARMPQVAASRRQGAGGDGCAPWASSNITGSVQRRVGAVEIVLVERDGHRPHRAVRAHRRARPCAGRDRRRPRHRHRRRRPRRRTAADGRLMADQKPGFLDRLFGEPPPAAEPTPETPGPARDRSPPGAPSPAKGRAGCSASPPGSSARPTSSTGGIAVVFTKKQARRRRCSTSSRTC